MTDKPQDETGPESLFIDWMKTATECWSSMASMWTEAADLKTTSRLDGKPNWVQESWESTQKTWQAFSEVMSKPEILEALFKGTDALPELLLKIGQANLNSFVQLQKEWIEQGGKIEEATQAEPFKKFNEDLFKTWTQLYEKEFRKFFHLPPVGPARFYQEKMNRFVERFNLFQADMAEFLRLLYLPVDKSYKTMQAKLTQSDLEGQLLADAPGTYKVWVSILEEHYQKLFKSPEYIDAMARAFDSLGEFLLARQDLLEDFLAVLALPTPRDMDALYKELYVLKKRVKELEKGKSKAGKGKK